MVPHSRACHSGQRRVMALSGPFMAPVLQPGCAGPGGGAGLCSICTPSQPSVELFSLSRRPPPMFPGNELPVSSQGRAFGLNFMLVNSPSQKKPGCVRGCASRFVLLGSRSSFPAHGHRSSPSSPAFSQGLSLPSKLPSNKQKSCYYYEEPPLKAPFRSRRFSALKERGVLFWL